MKTRINGTMWHQIQKIIFIIKQKFTTLQNVLYLFVVKTFINLVKKIMFM